MTVSLKNGPAYWYVASRNWEARIDQNPTVSWFTFQGWRETAYGKAMRIGKILVQYCVN